MAPLLLPRLVQRVRNRLSTSCVSAQMENCTFLQQGHLPPASPPAIYVCGAESRLNLTPEKPLLLFSHFWFVSPKLKIRNYKRHPKPFLPDCRNKNKWPFLNKATNKHRKKEMQDRRDGTHSAHGELGM